MKISYSIGVFLCVIAFQIHSIFCQNYRNDLQEISNEDGRSGRAGWFDSTQKMIAGPAGQMFVHFAKEMINRSAGIIGAGNWSQYSRGRSVNDEPSPLLNEMETPLFVGFLAAQGSGQDGCLQRAACNAPRMAVEYLRAGKALLQGAEIIDYSIPYNPRYNEIIQNVEQATVEGMEGAPCHMLYSCRV